MKTKTMFGHKYTWHEELGFWSNGKEDGRPVLIFPPKGEDRPSWWVLSPTADNLIKLFGDDAEHRAFSIAAGFITQG